MSERVIRKLNALAEPAVLGPQTIYQRFGSNRWTLWNKEGSEQIKTSTPFAQAKTTHLGTEDSLGQFHHKGTSRYDFEEGVNYNSIDNFLVRNLPNGTLQRFTGGIYLMCTGIQIWGGFIKQNNDWANTSASVRCSITQSISRQVPKGSKFDLIYLLPIPAYKNRCDLGHTILSIWKDPEGKEGHLLQQHELTPGEPDTVWIFSLKGIDEVSGLVRDNEYLRAEVTTELALSNGSSPSEAVVGGSFSGLGFVDYV